MKKTIFIIFICLSFIACKNKNNDNDDNDKKTDTVYINENQNKKDQKQYLTIKGTQIWIRSKPKTGEVIMKLDEGTKCKILEKGEEQTINGIKDFWYKIEYNGKTGWVFGSQTSLKQSANINEKTQIKNFLSYLIENIDAKNYTNLKYYFIQDSTFVIYNPGAVPYYNPTHYKEALKKVYLGKESDNIIFGRTPNFDMGSFQWSENGYFVNETKQDNIITVLTQYGQDAYNQYTIDKAKKYEKYISHKLLIAYSDGVTIYFGKFNEKWKIIAIDITTNDA